MIIRCPNCKEDAVYDGFLLDKIDCKCCNENWLRIFWIVPDFQFSIHYNKEIKNPKLVVESSRSDTTIFVNCNDLPIGQCKGFFEQELEVGEYVVRFESDSKDYIVNLTEEGQYVTESKLVRQISS